MLTSSKYLIGLMTILIPFNLSFTITDNKKIEKVNEITGKTKNEFTGTSFAVNSDGTFIAVGYPYADKNRGYVKVFKKENKQYVQVGEDILLNEYVNIGYNISINSTGDLVTFISMYKKDKKWNEIVSTFKFINGKWHSCGREIVAEKLINYHSDVKLNDEGNILAINQLNKCVEIYEFGSGTWNKIKSFYDENAEIYGTNISLSSSGNTISITSEVYINDEIQQEITVYNYENDEWKKFGKSIILDKDLVFTITKLSNNGRRIIVASSGNQRNFIQMYEYAFNSWRKKANQIEDIDLNLNSVFDIDINEKGNAFIIGNTNKNTFQVFTLGLRNWIEKASFTNPEDKDQTGFKVDINDSGDQIIVGSPYYSEKLKKIGRIEIYEVN